MSKIIYVNLGDLSLPEFQSHREIPTEHIQEIADSIKQIGVIEPLIVRDTNNGLEIVAGCVRYRSAILAGLKAVPCINMTLDPKSAEILKLHENVKRIPLDHVDQGHTFIMMMETFNMTERSVSECVGKSIAYISQHVSLVLLNNELTAAVKDKSISFSQARELMRVKDPVERKRFLSYCINDGATVQVLQRWVQEYLRTGSLSPSQEFPPREYSYGSESSKSSYECEACDKPIKTSEIMQVIYCPTCHQAIKQALFEEKQRNLANLPPETSQDASG